MLFLILIKCFLIKLLVISFQPLTIITRCSILDVGAVLDPPLTVVTECVQSNLVLLYIQYEKIHCLILNLLVIGFFFFFCQVSSDEISLDLKKCNDILFILKETVHFLNCTSQLHS